MRKNSPTTIKIFLALAALAGMALVVYATDSGPGVGGDATIYLTSARNLLAGNGLGWVEADGSFRLLPYTPPFYPLALSAAGLVAPDLVTAARWLNVLLFGLTVALTGWFFYRSTGRGWLAVLLAGALAASPVILGVQVWAMSESLFLFLGFSGLAALLAYLDRPRTPLLLAAAVLCGLAFLTRYMGVAYVAAGGLALLLFGRETDARFRLRLDRRALVDAVSFGIVAILPILIWLVIDFAITGTVSSRSAQPASAYWQRFLEMGPALEDIYLFWLVPDSLAGRLPGPIRSLMWLLPLAVLFAAALPGVRRRFATGAYSPEPSARRLAALLGLFIAVYLVVLTVVQVFTYPPITLASRMLSPVHMAALALVFTLVHFLLHAFTGRPNAGRVITAALYLACLALVGSYALRGALVAREYHRTGIGYMASEWRDSEVIRAARSLPPDVPIISNESTAIMFFLDRPAYVIQEIYQDQPQEEFTAYGAGDDLAQQVFREQGGALVLFNNTLREDFGKYGDQAEARIQALIEPLTPYFESADGGIYFYGPPAMLPPGDGN